MKRLLSRLIPALALVAFASPALAQSTGTLNVRASVARSCATEDVGVEEMNISYDVFAGATGTNGQGTGTLSVRCARNIPIQVEANAGTNAGDAYAGFNRAVRSATTGEAIGYTLTVENGAERDLPVGSKDTSVRGNGKNAVDVTFTAQLDTAKDVEPASDYNDDVVVTFTAEP